MHAWGCIRMMSVTRLLCNPPVRVLEGIWCGRLHPPYFRRPLRSLRRGDFVQRTSQGEGHRVDAMRVWNRGVLICAVVLRCAGVISCPSENWSLCSRGVDKQTVCNHTRDRSSRSEPNRPLLGPTSQKNVAFG